MVNLVQCFVANNYFNIIMYTLYGCITVYLLAVST